VGAFGRLSFASPSFDKKFRRRTIVKTVLVFGSIAVAVALVVIGAIADFPNGMHDQGAFAALAALLGAIVGASELTSRYRDEPLQALMSNAGLGYMLLNGSVSAATYGLLVHYAGSIFPGLAKDHLMASIVAGFGAMAILRSKFFTIRTERGEDISVGPDAAVAAVLSAADRGVDRARASRRLSLVFRRASQVQRPDKGRDFIQISLAAFQNLSDSDKAGFVTYLESIGSLPYTDELKLQAICYGMLSLTGEKNFNDIMTNLERYTMSLPGGSPPPQPPDSPVEPPAQPPQSPVEPPGQPIESPVEPPSQPMESPVEPPGQPPESPVEPH
jgi:hypothetical protein